MWRLRSTMCAVLLTAIPAAAQQDPFDGRWRLNVAKSTFAPGTAARNEIVTYAIVGDQESFVADGTTATGGRDVFKYTARYDGKEYPSTTVVAEDFSIVLRKIDGRTRERLLKRGAQVLLRTRGALSDDGRALTASVYAPGNGQERLRETRVFERQTPPEGDPFAGTWKLNTARSRLDGPTATNSETTTIKISGDDEVLHSEALTGGGTEEVTDYAARYDGRAYPAKVVTTDRRMVVLRKIDARTRERISRHHGTVVGLSRRAVSADGRTLTTTLYRVDDKGRETVTQVRVFDKQ